MRVLVTRPHVEGEALGAQLRRLGHEPLLAPLLEIRPSDRPLPDDRAARVLLFTSANGARMARALGLSGTAYAVGAATAQAARAAGFMVAGIAESDVAALAGLVARVLPRGAALLHVSGSDAAGDLVGELAEAGYDAKRFVAYSAIAATQLPAAAVEFLKGPEGAALLFSPRTAAVLVRLVTSAKLQVQAAHHRALALSGAVAKEAAALPWRALDVAARPEQQELLALL